MDRNLLVFFCIFIIYKLIPKSMLKIILKIIPLLIVVGLGLSNTREVHSVEDGYSVDLTPFIIAAFAAAIIVYIVYFEIIEPIINWIRGKRMQMAARDMERFTEHENRYAKNSSNK